MTAAIGVTIGLGFFAAAIAATVLTLIVMASFRRLETILPHQRILHLSLSYLRQNAHTSQELHELLATFGYSITDLACQISDDGTRFEYVLVLQSPGSGRFDDLVDNLVKTEQVITFHLTPSRD
jgi:putative Mg2+ transporter-C (MgtC) family protein